MLQNFEYCKQQINILNAKSTQDVNFINNRERVHVEGSRSLDPRTQKPPQNRAKRSARHIWQTVSSVQEIQSLESSMPVKERCLPSDKKYFSNVCTGNGASDRENGQSVTKKNHHVRVH